MLQLADANIDMSMSNDSVCVCVMCMWTYRCVPERQRVKEKCTCALVRDYCSMYICVKEREVRAADGRCCHTALDSALCDFSSEAQHLIETTCWRRKHGCWMKSDVKISASNKKKNLQKYWKGNIQYFSLDTGWSSSYKLCIFCFLGGFFGLSGCLRFCPDLLLICKFRTKLFT